MITLTTPRLLLRPFEEGTRRSCMTMPGIPGWGPIAGWPPHTSVENSREIIRTVFSAPNVFAVADRGERTGDRLCRLCGGAPGRAARPGR